MFRIVTWNESRFPRSRRVATASLGRPRAVVVFIHERELLFRLFHLSLCVFCIIIYTEKI